MKNKIEILKQEPLHNPMYVKPFKVLYRQNGLEKHWEMVKSHDSVAILLFHKERNAFLMVKQFRAPVFLNNLNNDGFTYELCAGIIDKNKSNVEIAKEEIFEECGFDVPLERIEKVTSFYSNVGVSGSEQTLYFAEINESMKVSEGGGIEHEFIELVYVSLDDANSFMFDESKPKTPGLMFSVIWYMTNKLDK